MEKSGKKAVRIYNGKELSAFCLQISILLSAAIPLDEGLSIMAEDAVTREEKELLQQMSEEVEIGTPFFMALEKTQVFPAYVIRMAKLGQQTGTMDRMMESLSVYYEKEYNLMRTIKNALTYPVIMIVMLLTVLFVLFTKVMPIFEGVYEQLGAQLSPVSRSAIRLGGAFSGAALVITGLLVVTLGVIYVASLFGHRFHLIEQMVDWVKRKNKIALAVAKRRFTSVLALTLHSGMELEKGLELAADLVENSRVKEQIAACRDSLEQGVNYYDAMKMTGLFSGFHIQMIKVGTRSGRLDSVMEEISRDYEQESEDSIDTMISRFEPTMVAVLAVSVGLVLLSVMLPLVGVLSAIG